MLEAAIWGLVQGLTEFLPVSSSGHLVLVPIALGVEPPDLATSALLHLGTLLAVVAYYRRDLASLLKFRTDPQARRVIWLLLLGTIPAMVGLAVRDLVEDLQESITAVSIALVVTGAIVWLSGLVLDRKGRVEDARSSDAVVVGIAQALALVPGISRSGMTITAGMFRGLAPVEAARYSFLLGVPAIAGAGVIEGARLADAGTIPGSVWVAVALAAVSGYAAIWFLVKLVERLGLRPYAYYCVAAGVLSLLFLA